MNRRSAASAALQVIGIVGLSVGVGLFSIPAGLIVASLGLFAIGLVVGLER